MERLTNCAQGYCEMYCKKYMLCFEDPEDCTFKDEIKLYDAIKSIEGIVPFERLLELACADKAGRLAVLPCIPGSDIYYLNSIDREVVPMVLLGFDILPTVVMAQTNYGKSIPVSQFGETIFLTREEAEAALALKGGEG